MSKTYEIVQLCKKVDINANKLYSEISKIDRFSNLSSFFKDMAEEEATHIHFWNVLSEYLESSEPYDLFDNSDDIIVDLNNAIEDSAKLLSNLSNAISEEQIFLVAYEMEFYLLHPSFEILFEYFGYLHKTNNMTENYDEHILGFLQQFKRRLKDTLQSQLLSKSLLELWNRNKELSFHSTYDFLTGIFSRKAALDRAQILFQTDKRNKKLSTVIMLDLDKFKQVNDKYGHLYGDKMLKNFVDVLLSGFRTTDLIGRYGGDEFIIFLSNVDSNNITSILNKIFVGLEQSDYNIGFSFGVAQKLFSGGNIDEFIEELIQEADQKMYEMKIRGNTFE